MKFTPQKLEGWGYRMVKISRSLLHPFSMIHPCDGQKDGRAIAYTRVKSLLFKVISHLCIQSIWCCTVLQSCRLRLHRHVDGNVVFEVTSTRVDHSTPHEYQVVSELQ